MADDKEGPFRVATTIYDRDDEALVLMAGLPAQGTMASTEMQRRLKKSVETLDQNLRGLQSVVKTGQEAADRLN